MIPSPPSKSYVEQEDMLRTHLQGRISLELETYGLDVTLIRGSQSNNNCGFHVCEFMRKVADSTVSGNTQTLTSYSEEGNDDGHIREYVFSNMFAGRFLTSEEMKSELDSLQTSIQRKEIEKESSVTTYFQNKVNELKQLDKKTNREEANQLESDFLKVEGKIHSYLTTDKMANDLIVERYVSMSNTFLSKNGIQNAFFYTPHYSNLFASKVDLLSSPLKDITDYQKTLKNIVKNKSITSHYIPINIPSSHWLLACVHFEPDPSNFDKRKVNVRVYDSCVDEENYNNKNSNLVIILSQFIQTIIRIKNQN